ncbi:MAG TPA: UDP-3-O-(3-hydroxymyristoyl)glucosamine N-acyltransferase [Terriglobales bacterium]|nr:UDP-3-O-(3-hydroxymyristoyl)glucosamine N-acyltransferase [Terriglobales bacterium]
MSATLQSRSLGQLASEVGARLRGDGSTVITGIASISSAKAGDLVFAADEKRLAEALRSSASAIVSGPFAENASPEKACIIAENPKLAFAHIASSLSLTETREGVAESAQIDLSARIGDRALIGPGVVIEAGVSVGNRSTIGPNSVLAAKVFVGDDCQIGPNVTICSGTELRDRVVVQAGTVLGSTGFGYVRDEKGRHHLFPQIGGLLIEDDVEIGANCTIDRGSLEQTVIRRGTKLDNMVHVGHNVEIGEDTVIAAQTGISGSSRIGAGAAIGGQVGIGEHAEIEGGTILGGQSGVLSGKVLRGKGLVLFGTPARPLKEFLKELATLSRLTRKGTK